jgi:MoaD family protein
MKIKVKFFTSLREMTGKKADEIQAPIPLPLKDFLAYLPQKYGDEVKEYMYDERGNVRQHLQILINGRGKGLETILKDGDTIAIFPPIGGG